MLRIPCRQQQPSVQHCPSTISRMPSIQHSGAGPGSTHQQEHLARRALARSLRHPAGEAGQLELVHEAELLTHQQVRILQRHGLGVVGLQRTQALAHPELAGRVDGVGLVEAQALRGRGGGGGHQHLAVQLADQVVHQSPHDGALAGACVRRQCAGQIATCRLGSALVTAVCHVAWGCGRCQARLAAMHTR
jgi:hypothetical protein